MRQPPTEVQVVLPVWGREYVGQFLDLSLPSLLAHGNVPALTRLAPCTFVLMTRKRDVATMTSHPLWSRLASCCRIRVEFIDDLVSKSSSTVLTLAYARAIRACGSQMVDTCFLLLVSDYVVADGSLGNAANHIFSGSSGVLAGNFQITEESARERIISQAHPVTGVLSIASRDLTGLALSSLHPATKANIVGSKVYDPDGNRLFWQVNDRCMIGRFFLMHMIALRPEVTHFVVGAPSDYGLIPELCPSGAVVAMTNSDEYMTVECQPQSRRVPDLVFGDLTPAIVAESLKPWATREHHENVSNTLVFHCGNEGSGLAETMARADAFVAEIYRDNPPTLQPHRQHPFWTRSLEHHFATAEQKDAPAAAAMLTGDVSPAGAAAISSKTWRQTLLGQVPNLRPWHPRYVDMARLLSALATLANDATLLIVSELPARIRDVLEQTAFAAGSRLTDQIDISEATLTNADQTPPIFDACLVLWPHDDLIGLDHVLGGLVHRLSDKAIVAVAIGQVFADDAGEVMPMSVLDAGPSGGKTLRLERIEGVSINGWRGGTQRAMMGFARRQIRRNYPFCWPAALAALLTPMSMLANLTASVIRNINGCTRASSLILYYRRQAPTAISAETPGAVAAHSAEVAARGSIRSLYPTQGTTKRTRVQIHEPMTKAGHQEGIWTVHADGQKV